MTAENFFQKVYPFTTEMISGYFKEIDFRDKTVLTVGSSSDQAFNALLLGAKHVKVYDINENAAQFGKLKRQVILNSTLDNVWDNVINIDMPTLMDDCIFNFAALKEMNPYMSSETNYKKLQSILQQEDNIEYQVGNIITLDDIDDEKYDVIITSNVLQYIDCYIDESENSYDAIKTIFKQLKDHLYDEGIMQFLYYYQYDTTYYPSTSLAKILKQLYPEILSMIKFPSLHSNKDAAIVYEKKR